MPIQDQMPRQDDDLLTRVAALEKQLTTVTGIAATAASIKQTIVSPAVGSSSNAVFTVTTSYATYSSFNIAVPVGFTRVVISASMFMSTSSNAGGGDFLNSRILIGGVAGAISRWGIPATAPWTQVSAFAAQSLTGLTGGTNILIEGQGRLDTGPGNTSLTTCNLTASAIFLS